MSSFHTQILNSAAVNIPRSCSILVPSAFFATPLLSIVLGNVQPLNKENTRRLRLVVLHPKTVKSQFVSLGLPLLYLLLSLFLRVSPPPSKCQVSVRVSRSTSSLSLALSPSPSLSSALKISLSHTYFTHAHLLTASMSRTHSLSSSVSSLSYTLPFLSTLLPLFILI